MEKRKRIGLLIILGVVFVLVVVLTIVLLTTLRKPTPETNKTPIVTLKKPVVTTTHVGAGFDAPTAIVSTGNTSDKRLFVVEREGRIMSFTPNEGGAPQVFLDIRDRIQASGEMGLLGLA